MLYLYFNCNTYFCLDKTHCQNNKNSIHVRTIDKMSARSELQLPNHFCIWLKESRIDNILFEILLFNHERCPVNFDWSNIGTNFQFLSPITMLSIYLKNCSFVENLLKIIFSNC